MSHICNGYPKRSRADVLSKVDALAVARESDENVREDINECHLAS
jgi:hypothetical protein